MGVVDSGEAPSVADFGERWPLACFCAAKPLFRLIGWWSCSIWCGGWSFRGGAPFYRRFPVKVASSPLWPPTRQIYGGWFCWPFCQFCGFCWRFCQFSSFCWRFLPGQWFLLAVFARSVVFAGGFARCGYFLAVLPGSALFLAFKPRAEREFA